MAYKIIIKPVAEKDLLEAIDWYETKKNGLGGELYVEILNIIEFIKSDPQCFQKRYKEFRITFTKRFNYGVHYTIEEDVVFIHAVLHTSQKLIN